MGEGGMGERRPDLGWAGDGGGAGAERVREDRLGLGCGAGWKAVPGDWALKRVGRGLGPAVGGLKWALVDTLGVD